MWWILLEFDFRFSRTTLSSGLFPVVHVNLGLSWTSDSLVSSLQNRDLMSQSCVESVVLALETWAPGAGGRRQRQLTGS